MLLPSERKKTIFGPYARLGMRSHDPADTLQVFNFVDVCRDKPGRPESFQIVNDAPHLSKIAHTADKAIVFTGRSYFRVSMTNCSEQLCSDAERNASEIDLDHS